MHTVRSIVPLTRRSNVRTFNVRTFPTTLPLATRLPEDSNVERSNVLTFNLLGSAR
jgi:hypothetical protein